MERYCFTFQLKPGTEAEYKRRHDEMWPELARVIHESGARNYSMFRRGLTVVGYCECEPDVDTAFSLIGATDINTKWRIWFEEVIEQLVDEDGNLFAFEEVWHQDEEI